MCADENALEVPSTPKTKLRRSFYGKSHKRSPLIERVEQAANGLCNEPVKINFRSSLLGPTVAWKVFRVQAEALTFARTLDDDVRVFSYELPKSDVPGKRAYLVTHPVHLYKVLQMRKPSDRCMYEVIAEDAPCKLYFDLEFERKHNPGRDGVAMVEELVTVACREWEEIFGDPCSADDVLWLDSSTAKKFSCHLIFQRTRMFRDNREAGAFVHLLCEKMKNSASLKKSSALAASRAARTTPLVRNKSSSEVLFCDEGVYTRNRNFRLFQCTKLNKDTPLVLSENDRYVRSLGKPRDDKDIFLDSLITWPPEAGFRRGLLQLSNGNDYAKVKQIGGGKTVFATSTKQDSVRSLSSPYPEIDAFIRSIIAPRGTIRQVSHFFESDTLVYDVLGYRYCENIGREHHSNGIMYVVDVNVGSFYQKCYDPDCRAVSFRSTPRPLPPECLPSFWLEQIPDEMLTGDVKF
ncbi:DNA-directed primase/polymerase protein-like isoform X1 [Amblyomma americanum]